MPALDISACSSQCRALRNDLKLKVSTLEVELSHLKNRYDALLHAKEQAAARYQADYKKWKEFKVWLFNKNKRAYQQRGSSPEGMRRNLRDVQKRVGVFQDARPDASSSHAEAAPLRVPDSATHHTGLGLGKENFPPTPVSIAGLSDSTTTLQSTQAICAPSKSLLASGRSSSTTEGRHRASRPGSLSTPPERKTQHTSLLHDGSSDTEPESQPLITPFKPRIKPPAVIFPALTRLSPGTPGTNHAYTFEAVTEGRPRKIRKLSNRARAELETPVNGQPIEETIAYKFKPQAGAERAPCTRNAPSGSAGGDYAKYKGRGRYGANDQRTETTTVNTLYCINAGQNGGVDYKFDEVVRDKAKRIRMHGGHCECCRDYYEAVGPLPSRPRAPLWRSPSPVDVSSNPEPERQHEKEVKAHKKEISRHRHQWSPPHTPPRYWDIGFPDTQEVDLINQEAAEMHRRKMERVMVEAKDENGRYRKR